MLIVMLLRLSAAHILSSNLLITASLSLSCIAINKIRVLLNKQAKSRPVTGNNKDFSVWPKILRNLSKEFIYLLYKEIINMGQQLILFFLLLPVTYY